VLTWTKTTFSPLVLEAQELPARVMQQVMGLDVTWVAQIDLRDTTALAFHASPEAVLAWCEQQLAAARW
jgi:hypothetical protein